LYRDIQEQKNIDGKTAYQKLKEAGVINYIDKNYDARHMFGEENIVWIINEYLQNMEVEIHQRHHCSCDLYRRAYSPPAANFIY